MDFSKHIRYSTSVFWLKPCRVHIFSSTKLQGWKERSKIDRQGVTSVSGGYDLPFWGLGLSEPALAEAELQEAERSFLLGAGT